MSIAARGPNARGDLRAVRDLNGHMGKAEQVLSPALIAGPRGATLGGLVRVMLCEPKTMAWC